MSSAKQDRDENRTVESPADSLESETQTPSEVSRRKFPIVGIGASAGGLEAYTTLLKALSPDLGMAYVLVPHLDPLRKSAFAPDPGPRDDHAGSADCR